MLENYDHAVARGAKIYAEFAGTGITADIVHINAHATSTPVGDGVQLDIVTEQRKLGDGDIAALNNFFGFGGYNVTVAFKSV